MREKHQEALAEWGEICDELGWDTDESVDDYDDYGGYSSDELYVYGAWGPHTPPE